MSNSRWRMPRLTGVLVWLALRTMPRGAALTMHIPWKDGTGETRRKFVRTAKRP